MQIINPRNGLTAETDDDISLGKARLLCRAVFFYRHRQNTGFYGQTVEPDNAAKKRDILASEPDIAPPYFPFFDQPSCDKFRGINSNRKADPLCGQNHSGVDPDHISPGSH